MQGHLHKQGKYWYLRIDIGKTTEGKRRRKNINTKCEKKNDAKRFQARIISEMDKGNLPNILTTTFSEYMNNWLKNYVEINCQKTTYDGYKVIVDKHIASYFKDIKLQELKPAHIQEYYDFLIREGRLNGKGGLTPATVKRHHNVIRKALSRAVMPLQLIESNPAIHVEIPKEKKYKAKVYTIEQLKILLNLEKDKPINIAIWIASGLGLRRGEVLGLKWDHVDFKNGLIHIKNTRVNTTKGAIEKGTKSEKSRVLPLPNYLKIYLKDLQRKQMKMKLICGKGYDNGNYVCSWDDGTPVNPVYISQRFKRVLELNNLPRIRFHDLRHTNATLLLEQNVNMKWLSEWLGHSSINTTMDIYAHVTENIKKEMANTLDNVFNQCP